jgi:hypothetical protein
VIAKHALHELAVEFTDVDVEPPPHAVEDVLSVSHEVGPDYGDKVRRLGRWWTVLLMPPPHDQLSELRYRLIFALVKRNFSPGEVWTAMSTSSWLSDLARRKGLKHAEHLIATEIVKAMSQVTPFAELATTAPGAMPANYAPAPKNEVPAERIFRTARAIAEETPAAVDWVVHGYLAAGAITEIVGKAKAAGKTTWLMRAIRCILDGADFIGNPTMRSPVVYLTEERVRSFRETLRRAGLDDRDDLLVLRWDQVVGWSWPDVIRAALAECRYQGAKLFVVDTVSQFAGMRGDSENNSGDALAVFQPLQEAAATGIAVAAVRHERKGGGDVGESGRGSSAFAGAADIHVAVRRPDGQMRPGIRVLHALSRFDETPDELMIELTPDGFVALGTPSSLAASEAAGAILAALPTDEEVAITEKELGEAMPESVKRTTAQTALRSLRDAGTVKRVGKGVKGDPFRYWHDENCILPEPEC